MLATLINFTTNESAFLGPCLKEAALFSEQIIVSVCDHFFDGVPEDAPLLNGICKAHPDVQFIQYPLPQKGPFSSHPPRYWHNLGRLIGYVHLNPGIDRILFLDADEIVEGRRFEKTVEMGDCDALLFLCYWYFREAKYRAKTWENNALLVKRDALSEDLIMHPEERVGTYRSIQGKKRDFVKGSTPYIHHYSWVRSLEQITQKVRSWGHRDERNWEKLVEVEWSTPFTGRDFVHGYEFETVIPKHTFSDYGPISERPRNLTVLPKDEFSEILCQFI